MAVDMFSSLITLVYPESVNVFLSPEYPTVFLYGPSVIYSAKEVIFSSGS